MSDAKRWTAYEIECGIGPMPSAFVASSDYDALAAQLAEAEKDAALDREIAQRNRDAVHELTARLAEAEQRILKAANDIDDIATDADLCDVVSQLRQTGRHRPSQHGGAGTRNESMRSACPSCPDGYVWTSEGPTGKACPTCKGKAYLGDDDEDDSASAADSVGEHQPDDE